MEEDSAVSAVLSEVLMIALVLILVPIVTISLTNQLPDDRVPTVTIKMGPLVDGTVTFYHKGGDWIKPDSIRLTRNGEEIRFTCDAPIYDLGNTITTQKGILNGDNIAVIAKNAIIFSGVVQP